MEIGKVAMSSQQTLEGASALNAAKRTTNEQVRNSSNEEEQVMTKQSINGRKEDYTAVSKDGDTLTLSENLKSGGISQKETKTTDGKVITGEGIMTDAALAKCSGQKLRLLLQQGKISKQQYERAMRKAVK